jgi:HlyD family secretion protein
MSGFVSRYWRRLPGLGSLLVILCASIGCNGPEASPVQGYAEGEFVYVAAPLAGALESLHVQRGTKVKEGDLLFDLEHGAEQATRDEAERRLVQARANWEDAKKGKRPSEIESIEAQLRQARAALALSETEFVRNQRLSPSGAAAIQDLDRTRSTRDQDLQRVAQLEADLTTAKLGARYDQIAAAEAEVHAREAALTRAEWDLSQKRQAAPQSGLVFDTFYYQGEWVGAGRPVIALLPPQNIKVRAFVSEKQVGTLRLGQTVQVSVDGVATPYSGTLSFISPRAEYTPPVIYSRESRDKLVFMVEIRFAPDTAMLLHPGQPVDVQFGS